MTANLFTKSGEYYFLDLCALVGHQTPVEADPRNVFDTSPIILICDMNRIQFSFDGRILFIFAPPESPKRIWIEKVPGSMNGEFVLFPDTEQPFTFFLGYIMPALEPSDIAEWHLTVEPNVDIVARLAEDHPDMIILAMLQS